jgi:hypothetical protein
MASILFGDRDEGGGRDPAVLGMIPVDQGFGADDASALQFDDRLIENDQLIAFGGLAQLVEHDEAARDGLLHVGLEAQV